jgi:CBS domain containing-hemolysin-like protein
VTEAHVSLDLFGVAWRLGATLFFVALNGFFVAAEFAIVKVRESRIEQLARDGARAAPTVQHILHHLDRYLSACQLGITLASLILGALGEPAVSVLLLAMAEGLGLPVSADSGWLSIVSIGIAFAVITTLHMTVGEQAPKMWALRRAEGTALATGPTLRVFAWVFGPFIEVINRISNGLLRLAGLPADRGHESGHDAEEIRSILTLSARAGSISKHEYELAENVFRMIELEVRHIVFPRVELDFLTLEHTLEENLERIRSSGHSRFALCELGLDTVIGIVHAKDVLDAKLRDELPDLRAVAREPVFVPDTMPISNFLRELQAKRQQCAVVLDEHGTAIGLAFREDALEEIVGPLGDEFDEHETDFSEPRDGVFELRGRMPLPELEDRLDFELSEDEREEEDTVGGHITARLRRLPRTGDTVRIGPYQATVVDVAHRRVQRLELELVRAEAPDSKPDSSPVPTANTEGTAE